MIVLQSAMHRKTAINNKTCILYSEDYYQHMTKFYMAVCKDKAPAHVLISFSILFLL